MTMTMREWHEHVSAQQAYDLYNSSALLTYWFARCDGRGDGAGLAAFNNALFQRMDRDEAEREYLLRGRTREQIHTELLKLARKMAITIEPQGGLEIALRGMLGAAGFRHVPSLPGPHPLSPSPFGRGGTQDEVRLTAADGGEHGLALALFKALQLLQARGLETGFRSYVTFDFEATDNDVATCEVVEIGAARVVNREIVARYHTLVKPAKPITPRATHVHGYTDADVRDAPSFRAVWPEFRAFVGSDVLVAHAGLDFDAPVLRRLAAEGAEFDVEDHEKYVDGQGETAIREIAKAHPYDDGQTDETSISLRGDTAAVADELKVEDQTIDVSTPSEASNVHATLSSFTFARLIWVRGEYRILSLPPPYAGHSAVCAQRLAAGRQRTNDHTT